MFYLRNFKKMAKYDLNLDSNISRTVNFYGPNFLSVVVRDLKIVHNKYQVPICRGSATTVPSRGAIFQKCEN